MDITITTETGDALGPASQAAYEAGISVSTLWRRYHEGRTRAVCLHGIWWFYLADARALQEQPRRGNRARKHKATP